MSGFEIVGLVDVSLQLVGLAKKAVDYFFDMAQGFRDRDAIVEEIREELYNFKQSTKFAHANLDDSHETLKGSRTELDLKSDIERYLHTIRDFGQHMQRIKGKKSWLPIRRAKYWMKVMKQDGDIQMLRAKLKNKTQTLLIKLSATKLVQIQNSITELSIAARFRDWLGTQRHQESQEQLHEIKTTLEAISIRTSAISEVDLDDDELFDYSSSSDEEEEEDKEEH